MHYSDVFFKKIAVAIVGVSVILPAGHAQNTDGVPPQFKKKEEGWFWKKEPPAPAPKKEAKTPSTPNTSPPVKEDDKPKPPAQPAPFSVVWLRENMPKLLERAIDDPTPDNLAAYLYVQRVLLDKSQTFAEKAHQVVLSDPMLDEANRIPIAAFGRAAYMRATDNARQNTLKDLAQKGGIWFFYQTTCQFCRQMSDMVATLEMRHGFLVNAISLDGKPIVHQKNWIKDEGQAKQLKVQMTPTVMYVVPPNNYYVISQGMMVVDDLEDRLLVAAENANMIPPEQLVALYPDRSQLISSQSLKDGATTDDPVALVKAIRGKILNPTTPTGTPINSLPPVSPEKNPTPR